MSGTLDTFFDSRKNNGKTAMITGIRMALIWLNYCYGRATKSLG
jgi:hypothetical protein